MAGNLETAVLEGWFDKTTGALVFIKPALAGNVPKSYVGLYSTQQEALPGGVTVSGLLAVGSDGALYKPDGSTFTGVGVSRFVDLIDAAAADIVGINISVSGALNALNSAKAAKTGQVFEKQIIVSAPVDGFLGAMQAETGYSITRITAKLVSGTTTLTPSINGTPMTALNVSSTKGHNDYAAANVVAPGDEVTFSLSASSTPVGLSITIVQTRNLT